LTFCVGLLFGIRVRARLLRLRTAMDNAPSFDRWFCVANCYQNAHKTRNPWTGIRARRVTENWKICTDLSVAQFYRPFERSRVYWPGDCLTNPHCAQVTGAAERGYGRGSIFKMALLGTS
jgi:hypothetical protein